MRNKGGSALWSVLFGLCFLCVVVHTDLILKQFGCEKLNPVSNTDSLTFADLCEGSKFDYEIFKNDANNFISYTLSIYLSSAPVIPGPDLSDNKYFTDSSIEQKQVDISQSDVTSESQVFDLSSETVKPLKQCGKAILLATLEAEGATSTQLKPNSGAFSRVSRKLEIECEDKTADVSISFQGVEELAKNVSISKSIQEGPILPQLGKNVSVVIKNEDTSNFPARTRGSALFATAYLRPLNMAFMEYLYMVMGDDPAKYPLGEIKDKIMQDNVEKLALDMEDTVVSTSNLIPVQIGGSVELKAGEQIIVDSNKIVLPKRVPVCKGAILIVSVSCVSGCPDRDRSNNYDAVPVYLNCMQYLYTEEPMMCQVHPNWNMMGNEAWLLTRIEDYREIKMAQYQDESWIPFPEGPKIAAKEKNKMALNRVIIDMEAGEKDIQGICSTQIPPTFGSGSLQQIADTAKTLADTVSTELSSVLRESESVADEEIPQLETIVKTIREIMRIFLNTKSKQMDLFIYPIKMLFQGVSRNYYRGQGRDYDDRDGYDDNSDEYNDRDWDGYNGYDDQKDYGYNGGDGRRGGRKKDDYYKDDDYKDDHYKDDYYKDDYYKDDDYKGDRYKDDYYKDDYYKDGYYKDDYYKNDSYFSEESDGSYEDNYGKDDYNGYGGNKKYNNSTRKSSRVKRQTWLDSDDEKLWFPEHKTESPYYPDMGNDYWNYLNIGYAIEKRLNRVVEFVEDVLAGKRPKDILPRRFRGQLSKYLNAVLYSKPYFGDSFDMIDKQAEKQLRDLMMMILKRDFPVYFIYAIVNIADDAQKSASENIGSFRVPVKSEDLQSLVNDLRIKGQENVREFEKMSNKFEQNSTDGVLQVKKVREGMELLLNVLDFLQKEEIITTVTKLMSLIQGEIFAGDIDCLLYGNLEELGSEEMCKFNLASARVLLDDRDKDANQYTEPKFWKTEKNNIIKRGEYCPLTGYFHWAAVAVCSCNHRICDLYGENKEYDRWDRDTKIREKRQTKPEREKECSDHERSTRETWEGRQQKRGDTGGSWEESEKEEWETNGGRKQNRGGLERGREDHDRRTGRRESKRRRTESSGIETQGTRRQSIERGSQDRSAGSQSRDRSRNRYRGDDRERERSEADGEREQFDFDLDEDDIIYRNNVGARGNSGDEKEENGNYGRGRGRNEYKGQREGSGSNRRRRGGSGKNAPRAKEGDSNERRREGSDINEHRREESGNNERRREWNGNNERRRGQSDNNERRREGSGNNERRRGESDNNERRREGSGNNERRREESDNNERRREGSGRNERRREWSSSNEHRREGSGNNERTREGSGSNEHRREGSGSNERRREGSGSNERRRKASGDNEHRREESGNNEHRREESDNNERRREERGDNERRREERGDNERRREWSGSNERRREGSGINERRRESIGSNERRREGNGINERRRERNGYNERRRERNGSNERRREGSDFNGHRREGGDNSYYSGSNENEQRYNDEKKFRGTGCKSVDEGERDWELEEDHHDSGRRKENDRNSRDGRRDYTKKNKKSGSDWRRGANRVDIKLIPTKGLTTVGNSSVDGTLAIKVRDSIGLACGSNWTQENTLVACSQILRRRPADASFEIPKLDNIDFGRIEPIPIMLDSINCSGEEKSLASCNNLVWGQKSCNDNEPVAILCA